MVEKKKLNSCFEITKRTGCICPLWFSFKTYSQRPPWLTERCGSKKDLSRIFVDVGNRFQFRDKHLIGRLDPGCGHLSSAKLRLAQL